MFGNIFKQRSNYRFADPENTVCMVCSHVLEKQAPILYVSHDAADGMWQFLCGAENHESQDAKLIALVEVTAIDPGVNDLHEMPTGVGATRDSTNAKWQPFKL